MKRVYLILLLAFLLTNCSPAATPVATPSPEIQATATPIAPASPWWEKAIFYEIFVRSFYDSDGNGIGDFNGITAKLDYLDDLGITAIWLMPIHPSPTYHGYDVIDYRQVNPDYGTMDDFKRMLAEAHVRDIRIIIDLVVNHTSKQNPWFMDANNDPQSPYRNWYIWSETNPGYAGPLGRAWHDGKHGYYYGVFGDNMPDLNFNNPAVTTEMNDITKFWLNEVGIDGFRLDAVKYLIEQEQSQESTHSTHVWLRDFYTYYKSLDNDAYTVGEVSGASAFIAKTYTGDQLDEVFAFELAGSFLSSANGETNSAVNRGVQYHAKTLPTGAYATFLTNHDQNRVMSVLGGSIEKAKVAAALMLTAPGTPFIYYGEEIGMEGMKPDEQIRRPMQWSAAINGGFTTGIPWEPLDPNYPIANVSGKMANPQSLLAYYRSLIALRRQHSALSGPDVKMISPNNLGVYSVLRYNEDEQILVVTNLSKTPVSKYSLNLQESVLPDGSYHLTSLFGTVAATDLTVAGGAMKTFIPLPELAPYTTYIFLLGSN